VRFRAPLHGVSLDKDAKLGKMQLQRQVDLESCFKFKIWDEPIAIQYKVESIPATFILDASGNIVAKDLRGPASRAKVLELLAK
jgi:hypothetical protein